MTHISTDMYVPSDLAIGKLGALITVVFSIHCLDLLDVISAMYNKTSL